MHIYQKPEKNMLRDMLFAENFSCLYMKAHESIHRKEQTYTHTYTHIFAHMRAHTHKRTQIFFILKNRKWFFQTKSHRLFPIHSHFNLIIFVPPNNNMFLVWGSVLPHWHGRGVDSWEFLNLQKYMPWVIRLYAHFWRSDGLYLLSSSQSDMWLNETKDPLANCSSFQSKI